MPFIFPLPEAGITHDAYWVASSFVVISVRDDSEPDASCTSLSGKPPSTLGRPSPDPGEIRAYRAKEGGKSERKGVAGTVSASRYSHREGFGEGFGAISGNTPDGAGLASLSVAGFLWLPQKKREAEASRFYTACCQPPTGGRNQPFRADSTRSRMSSTEPTPATRT
jgi:hypothetical protein